MTPSLGGILYSKCLAFVCSPHARTLIFRTGNRSCSNHLQVGLSWYTVSWRDKVSLKQLCSRNLVYARHSINEISIFRVRRACEMNYQSFVSHCSFSWLQKHHLQISSDYISEIRVMHELVASSDGRKGHCRKNTDQFQMWWEFQTTFIPRTTPIPSIGYQDPPLNSLWRECFSTHTAGGFSWLLPDARIPAPRVAAYSLFLWADEQQMAMCFSRTEPVAFPSQLGKLIWMKREGFRIKPKKKKKKVKVLIPRQHAFLNREEALSWM